MKEKNLQWYQLHEALHIMFHGQMGRYYQVITWKDSITVLDPQYKNTFRRSTKENSK